MARTKNSRSRKGKRSSSRSSRKRSNFSKWPTLRLNATQKALLIGITLIFFTAILLLSLLSPNQGQLTAALASLLWQGFGWGGLVVPIFLGATGFFLVLAGMEQAPQLPRFRLLGLALMFLTFETFASWLAVVSSQGTSTVWSVAQQGLGGGYVGGTLAWALGRAVGQPLSVLALALLGVAAAVLLFDITREDARATAVWLWARRPRREPRPAAAAPKATTLPSSPPAPAPTPAASSVAEEAAASGNGQSRPDDTKERPRPPTERRSRRQRDEGEQEALPDPLFASPTNGAQWELPALEKMLDASSGDGLVNVAVEEQRRIIEHTLDSFGAPALVVDINQGPTVTQFGVEPQFIERRNGKRIKVKVGKIASLADDLALALAAHSVRVEAPVPGKGYVGLEVPNSHKALVSLRDVMQSPAFTKIRSPLRIGLGENVSGEAVAADLIKMPHLLVAGATGSGKSVCVNSLIACLLLQNTPEQLRMVMVDPKRVELTGYNGVPHLVAPVVVDMERVIATLQWALREMDSRYHKLSQIGARNIADYNRKVDGSNRRQMPYIVIIIDELADLMMVSPEETERSVTRLAQMARATGIHMVIATQRPSVDVVTGLIKANFPARVAFAVASGTDSRVILDTTGAERLLGQGDMLFQSPDAGAPVRLQGTFVSDRELSQIISYWKSARRFNRITTAEARQKEEDVESASTLPPPTQQPLWEDLLEDEDEAHEYEDELVPEAIALVRDLGKASTSLLQRRFRIGYTRASRIMDVMEQEGIIGPPTGTSKAREVLDYGAEVAEDEGGEDNVSDFSD